MCNIGQYVISTGISVIDMLIEVIVGETVVNNTAETSGFFSRLWASRDSSEEAMEFNLVEQNKNVQEFRKSSM